MDPYKLKISVDWFRNTVFGDEAIRSDPARSSVELPSLLRTARSLEGENLHQTREAVFMKQGKLLVNYEDDFDYHGSALQYYPTYQSLTDEELRGYFAWRTKWRGGDVCKTSLSFVFLYIYELLNQIGVDDPMDGYLKLIKLQNVYGQIDGRISMYLNRWLTDYVVYYDLDAALISKTFQTHVDQSIPVLEHIQEEDPAKIIDAVKKIAPKWLERSKFYAARQEDMDEIIVRVLRRVSAHHAAKCKKSMVEQYVCGYIVEHFRPFGTAIFCDPLRRRSYEYIVNDQNFYRCEKGVWSVRRRDGSQRSFPKLEELLKTIDAVLREEFDYGHPIKHKVETKWILQAIREEAQALLAEKKAAEAKKITIDYSQLTKIRQDAAVTQEKLIVDEEAELPEEPPAAPSPPEENTVPGAQNVPALSNTEYRLLHCLLYGEDTGWVRTEGHLLSVLVDSINEKLYDVFQDSVLDDTPQLVEDYIDNLKEMVH